MEALSSEIKHELTKHGASLVGFAYVENLPVEMTGGLSWAVSIAVALDPDIVREISNGPTRAYFSEYERLNNLLARLGEQAAKILTKAGKQAEAIKATTEKYNQASLSTRLQHKTIATRAGLGWIGKSALLITKEYGAAVRLATVLTDAEFEVGTPINSSHCGNCNKCVNYCPAKAITGQNWEIGLKRESIYDAFACCDTATKLSKNQGITSAICGICINVCPWTQEYLSRELTG